MKFIGCIFARGGSKGLPNKNIKEFNGKPLIGWAISHAKKVRRISKVIVSTDSEAIATIAQQYGAEVPFIRPKELASDNSPEWDSWQHLVKYLNQMNELPDALVSVPTSSPLRNHNDIEKCIDKYSTGSFDCIVTASKSRRNPYFNIIKKDKDGFCNIFEKEKNKITNRQSAPETYDLTTVCYVISTKFIQNNSNIFDGKVGMVEIPEERSIDIDNLWDFKLANLIYSSVEYENKK